MTERVLGPTGSRRRKRTLLVPALLILAAAVVFGVTSAVGASLPGSNFEIDANANLKLDGSAPAVDWATLTHPNGPELRKTDLATGQTDDSYAGGSKEDDTCPNVGDGSIPNNKSDLLNFGVYVEGAGAGSAGFLNLFWNRVAEPSGTTLMDFEFNKSQTDCGNGVNRVRSLNDLLIEYRIEQGGATATLKVRKWTGSAWGPADDLSASEALGTINTTSIPANESDGLGAMNARTFGEASIDLDAIFEEGKCQSLGSAFLKSRSSDSFTSQMKDLIKPVPVSITNCGSVLVKKTAAGTGSLLSGATFTITPGQVDSQGNEATSSTIPATSTAGYYCIQDILLDGAGETHRVEETVPPPGYNLPSPAFRDIQVTSTRTCAQRLAESVITPDATFVDPPKVGAIKVSKTGKDKACTGANTPAGRGCTASATRAVSGVVFEIFKGASNTTPANKVGEITTLADGTACLGDLALGTYTVHELSAPAGWQKAADQNVEVTESTCTSVTPTGFVNQPLTNVTVSVSPQIAGTTASKISCARGGSGIAPDPADSSPNDFDDTSETYKDNPPSTVVCTIEIDP